VRRRTGGHGGPGACVLNQGPTSRPRIADDTRVRSESTPARARVLGRADAFSPDAACWRSRKTTDDRHLRRAAERSRGRPERAVVIRRGRSASVGGGRLYVSSAGRGPSTPSMLGHARRDQRRSRAQAAACWLVVTGGGRFTYAASAGSANMATRCGRTSPRRTGGRARPGPSAS
jgi:hypothetical protein